MIQSVVPLVRGLGLGLLVMGLLSAQGTATMRNRGVVVSEIHHVSTPLPGPTPVGATLPSYIEIMNVDRVQPVIVGPGAGGMGGVLIVQVPGGQSALNIPPGFTFGANTQGAANPQTLVIAEASLGLPNEIVNAQFFTSLPANAGAVGVPTRICLAIPTPSGEIFSDEVVIGNPTATPGCPPGFGTVFNGPSVSPTGYVRRALYLDSDTLYDFASADLSDPITPMPLPASPGAVNPELDHVGGFRWNQNPNGTLVNQAPGASTAMIVINEPLVGVLVPNHPEFAPEITDPLFDRSLQPGNAVMATGTLAGTDPLLTAATGANLLWQLQSPPDPLNPGAGPGVLTVNQSVLTQVGLNVTVSPTLPGTPLIQRFLSDNITDATPMGTGGLSKVQIDVLPGSTGGGNVWCDMIVYDMGGNRYRAKVRNWPSSPLMCMGAPPNLGLGSNVTGNLDIIALCFPANAEIFLLPSLATGMAVGTGALFGINPDALTLLALGMPLGTPAMHVNVNPEGYYVFSVTDPMLSGITLDMVAIEYSGVSGFIAPASPALRITIL